MLTKMKMLMVYLLFICPLLISGQTEKDFEFKLETPQKLKITANSTDKIPVKITFNADTVNAVSAYIMTRVNDKMSGFSASTTMESPFTDDIPASYLGKGTHKVEYLLLPPGKDTSNPYAKITLEVTVVDGEDKLNSKVNIDEFAKNVFKTINENDVKTFGSYCLTEQQLAEIVKGIIGITEKDKAVKAELQQEEPSELLNESISAFKKLQKVFADKKFDVSNSKFIGYQKKDLKLEMPGFKAMKIGFRISCGESSSLVVYLNLFITKDEALIFGFRYSNI